MGKTEQLESKLEANCGSVSDWWRVATAVERGEPEAEGGSRGREQSSENATGLWTCRMKKKGRNLSEKKKQLLKGFEHSTVGLGGKFNYFTKQVAEFMDYITTVFYVLFLITILFKNCASLPLYFKTKTLNDT